MFDDLPPLTPLEKLSGAIYRWRGIDKWPVAEATVNRCEWFESRRYAPEHYSISFSYLADGEIQQGSYKEYDSEGSQPFKPGETFSLSWNPKRPERYHTGKSTSERTVVTWAVTIPLAIFLLIWILVSRR
jgi:hypothetical protein